MIKYTLVCDDAHAFEGWFRNSGDFDAQRSRDLVACPVCGTTDVRKSLMAPAVSTARKKEALVGAAREEMQAPETPATPEPAVAAPSAGKRSSALLPKDFQQKEILEALRIARARIVENSENVGERFASEARKIHSGEAQERSIYGETSPRDAEALAEEGIAVFPLPELPEDKN
ncbi:DUF1178 family protein [Roseibium sp. AS2]|uniref:DUF1178 family protein n=1 Tax=Roseibium sp. AS2 TaxID=3135781 RepID=UPI003177493D